MEKDTWGDACGGVRAKVDKLPCADIWLCCVSPVVLQAVAAAADEDEEVSFQVSTAPDDLRSEILVSRMQASGSIPSNLMAGAALNLPNRSIVSALAVSLTVAA